MGSNVNNFLPESMFFTARPRPLPLPSAEVSTAGASPSTPAASTSSRYYSARIQSLTERMTNLNMSEVDAVVEASKDHWTQVEPIEPTTASNSVSAGDASETESGTQGAESSSEMGSGELYEENLAFLRRLQSEEDPLGEFFEDSIEWEYVLGEKIAEGGQAAIYQILGVKFPDGEVTTSSYPTVMKVFKGGISLVDLRNQWPLALLHKLDPGNPNFLKDETISVHCNSIHYGCLLGDGRFGFVMMKYWGDLRKLMDLRMQHNGNFGPPFMLVDGNYDDECMWSIMLDIAKGMRDLHREGTLHRDMKASNILIWRSGFDVDPLALVPLCAVGDFECSIGVVGTGYWRAPEILKALKNHTLSTTPNIFTTKSDVYSYGMTCYEILTGHLPFEDIENDGKTSIDDVLGGKRPSLPRNLKPWMKEWLDECWHMDPLKRPSFEEIVDFLSKIWGYDSDTSKEDEGKDEGD